MEDQKKSVFQPSIVPGIFLGVALIIFSLIMFLLDVERKSPLNYIAFAVMAAGLYFIMITVRDKTLGGVMSYGQAFGAGFWGGLFAAIVGAIFTYFFVSYINPDMISEILIEAEEEMLNSNSEMSDEQIEQALSFTENFIANAGALTILSFITNVISATILSLIIAIFAKRENTVVIVEEEVTDE